MKKSNTNKSTKRFKSWVAVLALAASLVIMGLFTACPNAAKGGNSGGEIVFSYKQVAYNDLDAYLAGASSSGVNYIEITGDIPAADFKGKVVDGIAHPGKLGKKIQAHPTKKVALKLPAEVAGLTDMNFCFKGCTNLVSLANIPSGVKNMEGCFINCTSLTQSPAIPSSVNYMIRCFSGCTNLTQAPVIPDGITNMYSCFSGCKSLTKAPVIPANVKNMEECFSGCTNLTQAPVIPDGVTDMSKCFYLCTNLTQAPVIPNGVKSMNFCFYLCTSLTQGPDIPALVTTMKNCFMSCSALKGVKLNCPYNGTGGAFKDAFKNCTVLEDGGILVPSAHLAAYQTNAAAMGTTKEKFAGF